MSDTTRITVALPTDQVEQLRRLTGDISGYVTEVVSRKIRHRLLAEDLRRYEEDHGEFTEEELDGARERLYAAFADGPERNTA